MKKETNIKNKTRKTNKQNQANAGYFPVTVLSADKIEIQFSEKVQSKEAFYWQKMVNMVCGTNLALLNY